MKISKKVNSSIMRISAVLALLMITETGFLPQSVMAAGNVGMQNSSSGNYTGSNPSQTADFSQYMKRMQDKIKANWKPPVKEKDAQIIVKYRILKDGTLDSYGILSSSGAQDLDNAAIEALRSASPFEPLPASFNKESILVQFTFDYQKPNTAMNNPAPVNPPANQNQNISQQQPVTRQLANIQQQAPAIRQPAPAIRQTTQSQTYPVNRQIASAPQVSARSQIADFQPLVPINVQTPANQPMTLAGTPAAPIRIKAAPGESIQVEKLPPKADQKIFPPVRAVQSYEQTPATLTGSSYTVQKYVQAPESVMPPAQVTQVYSTTPPPPVEILEPIQPPRAIVPLPPKNTDPRNVAVPPPIRQTPAVDITTYAQGELLDLDSNKMAAQNTQVTTYAPGTVIQASGQTPVNAAEINRIVPPAYPEVEYVRFEAVEEQPTTLTTGINKVEMPVSRRKKLTRPVTEEQYPDVPEHRVIPAPVPQGQGVYVSPVRVPDLSAYMRKVERKITKKWRPPLSDYSTKVVVNYVIHNDGELGKYYVSESSGNSRMDASAMDALKKAAPFPPLPAGCQNPLEVKFTFDYNVYKNKSEREGIKEMEDGENL